MASKSNVFGRILAVFLVLIILSGTSFLAYNLLFSSNGGMNMGGMQMDTDNSTSDKSKEENNTDNNNSNQDMDMDMGEDSSSESMDMSQGSEENNMTMEDSGTSVNSQYSAPVIMAVLENKEDLERTLMTLKESISLMKLDPMGNELEQNNGMEQESQQTQGSNSQNAATDENGNTIVNVFPQSSNNTTTMPDMGTTYDPTKMEQLHSGLYKVSVGMQLLEQLKQNLGLQLEQASINITNPSQYYNNQYLITMQNRNKLSEALNYINEASTLVNINPYISQTGIVYDSEKMAQMHDSIDKLAVSVVNLNKINDNFSKQSIELINYSQNVPAMTDMKMDMGGSIFSSINITTIIYGLVIVFILIFITSIFGYISRLLKS